MKIRQINLYKTIPLLLVVNFYMREIIDLLMRNNMLPQQRASLLFWVAFMLSNVGICILIRAGVFRWFGQEEKPKIAIWLEKNFPFLRYRP